MNILWLEDFDKLELSDTLLRSFFGGLLDFNDWDGVEYRLLNQPDDLRRYCSEKSHHCIHLCRHYFDYKQFIDRKLLKEIDLILIDINLEKAVDASLPVPVDVTNPIEFHQQAGFYIFNDLIHRGFPQDRLCFMTGQTARSNSNSPDIMSLKDFQKRLSDLYIPQATGFEKKNDQYAKLRQWIDDKHTDYYRLRRGIIEACQYLRSQSDQFRIKNYLNKDRFEDHDAVLDLDDYLNSLERLLPIQEPPDSEKSTLYKIVVRTLSHEWEALKPQHRNAVDSSVWAFSHIMKTTRNWIAHNSKSIFNKLTAQDVAYFFICNMRALFDLGQETRNYETILLELFVKPGENEHLERSQEAVRQKNIPLVDTYVRCFNEKETQQVYFHNILNELQKDSRMLKKYEDDRFFVTALYQFFWQLSSDFRPKPDKARINDNQKNQIFVSSYHTITPFNYSQSPFLFDFASHIFTLSFPEHSFTEKNGMEQPL